MRLLFVIKSITGAGGAERVLANLTGELTARGHDVTIASFDAHGVRSFYPLAKAVQLKPISVGQVASSTSPGEIFRRIFALRKLVREFGPDVTIGFMHSAYIPLALAGASKHSPLIGSEHITFEHYRPRHRDRLLLYASARSYAAITVVSQAALDSFPAKLAKRMVVMPNPVVRPAGNERSQTVRRNVILTVGRLVAQKDQATLVRAFALTASQYPDWILRIVGEGELRGELEALAHELGIGARVELPGSIAQIEQEFAAAKIFVLPSRYESFGLATAEALAAGLPAIGFADCLGTNELIVQGENGILVKGSDRAQDLAAALRQLMESRSLRKSLSRSAATNKAFELSVVADQWERLLSKVDLRHKAGRR